MLCLVRVSPRADISGSVVAVGCGVQVWASLGIYRLLSVGMLWMNLRVGFWWKERSSPLVPRIAHRSF